MSSKRLIGGDQDGKPDKLAVVDTQNPHIERECSVGLIIGVQQAL